MSFSTNAENIFVRGPASWDSKPNTVALVTTRLGNAVADSTDLFAGAGLYSLATPQWPVAEGYWAIAKDSVDDTAPRFDMGMPSLYHDSIDRAFEATYSPGPSAMFDSPLSGNWLDLNGDWSDALSDSDSWSDASSDSDSWSDASSDNEGYFSEEPLVARLANIKSTQPSPTIWPVCG